MISVVSKGLVSLMNLQLPSFETEGDELRLEEMIQRIRQLERDESVPPDFVLALSSMKEEIESLQSEMEAIKTEVGEAVRVIQRETNTMLAQVAQMEQIEREELERAAAAAAATKTVALDEQQSEEK